MDDVIVRDGPRILEELRKRRDAEQRGAATLDARAEKSAAWPDPQALPDGLPSVDVFDIALLPSALQPWAADIIERVQCPADYVGATIMCSLGALVGRKVGVRPQALTDWTEVCNQWACLVGRPGTLKSPAQEQALAPLKRLAANAVPMFEAAQTAYAGESKLAQLRAEVSEKTARAALAKDPDADIDLLTDKPATDEPTLKRYITSDSTPAALGELLRQNANGVLVHRDELVSLLKSLDRDDNAEGRGFYLTGWNGASSYTFDRIARGMHLHVDAVCLSVLGSTQPGRIAEYIRHAVKGGAGDDGLIQRFGLTVWPDTNAEWQDVDRQPNSEARQNAWATYQRLDALGADEVGATKERFSRDALSAVCGRCARAIPRLAREIREEATRR